MFTVYCCWDQGTEIVVDNADVGQMTSRTGLGWRSMKCLQQRKIAIVGERYYAPPTLLTEEGTERRWRCWDRNQNNNRPNSLHLLIVGLRVDCAVYTRGVVWKKRLVFEVWNDLRRVKCCVFLLNFSLIAIYFVYCAGIWGAHGSAVVKRSYYWPCL